MAKAIPGFEDVPEDERNRIRPESVYGTWAPEKQLRWLERQYSLSVDMYNKTGKSFYEKNIADIEPEVLELRDKVHEIEQAELKVELEEKMETDFERFRKISRANIEEAYKTVGERTEADITRAAELAESVETATRERQGYRESLAKARAAASGVGREGTSGLYLKALEKSGRKEISRVQEVGKEQINRYRIAGEETIAAISASGEGVSATSVAAGQKAIGATLEAGSAKSRTIQAQGQSLYASPEETLQGAWGKIGSLGVDQETDWRAFKAKI